MAHNRGKQFELKLREDFKKIPGSFIYRLPDQVSGFKTTSANVSDFVGYIYPNMFLIEAKTISGNTFPFGNFSQLEKLLQYDNVPGLRRGVIIWFVDHDRVVYVPVTSAAKMKQDGKKSINIRTLDSDGYDYVDIPSSKKRVFLDSDYSVLKDTPEGW